MSDKQSLLLKLLKWVWTQEQEDAFVEIKEKVANHLRIYYPQNDKPFILRTCSIAGVLFQFQNDLEIPICFISGVMKDCENKYGITELEFVIINYYITGYIVGVCLIAFVRILH